MRIPAAWLKRFAVPLALCGAVSALAQPLAAQTDRELVRLDRRLNNLIRSLDEIKWQNITIYKLEEEFRARLTKGLEAGDKEDIEYVESIGQTIYDDPLPDFFETVRQFAASAITNYGRNIDRMKQMIGQKYGLDPDDLDETELNNAVGRVLAVNSRRESRPSEFFLVTSRDKTQPRLIALLGIRENERGEPEMTGNPWVGSDLYRFLVSNGPDSTMYTELKQAVSESSPSVSNQMFVLRDLSQIDLVDRTQARASYLDAGKYQYVLTSISIGRPLRSNYVPDTAAAAEGDAGGGLFGGGGDMFANMFGGGGNSQNEVEKAEIPNTTETPYELTVGTDVLFSFINYKLNNDKKAPETEWGVELINGFDQLNYPSIWGGRLTLNAILENIRIGAVLPQIGLRFGDDIATSGIGSQQQRLVDGYGLAVSGDFVAPLLDNSGLFNFYASYTFTDPVTEQIGLRTFDTVRSGGVFPERLAGERGFLIRFATQAYYSFGFFLDAEARHLFRLKVGGTLYGVDTYSRGQDTTAFGSGREIGTTMYKMDSKTFGGVSGKVEYMKGGQRIPYGAGVQYVDNSILADLWLQFIVNPTLDLKFGLKYFTPVFRTVVDHPWENSNLVVPTVSLKYHFGM